MSMTLHRFPEKHWTRSFPHKVGIGIGYQRGNVTLDTAYLAVFLMDRNVNNQLSAPTPLDPTAVYNQVGTYETIAHLGSLSLSYRF